MHQSSCCRASSDARRKRSTSSSSSRIFAFCCESCESCERCCDSRVRCCDSGALCCKLSVSASGTSHHDLLREDVADFLAVVLRLDDAELDDFFAAGRRPGDDSLDDDFFAAGRGRLDEDSPDADFFAVERDLLDVAAGAGFAELLAAGADLDRPSES